jgi:hypothetical protein
VLKREKERYYICPALEADEMNYPAATKRLERNIKHSWTKRTTSRRFCSQINKRGDGVPEANKGRNRSRTEGNAGHVKMK